MVTIRHEAVRAILNALRNAKPGSKERRILIARADGQGDSDEAKVKASSNAAIAKMYELVED